MTEKENKAVVNAEMEEAIAEAHLPEVIIDDGAEKQEESLARPARMITDDFDQDNPVEFIHPEDEIRLKWSEIRNDASRRRIKNCEVLGCSKMPRDQGTYITTKINDFKTIIPAEEFFLDGTFSDNINETDPKAKCERQIQMAQRMLGAKISVIITKAISHYNEETGERTYAIEASRVAAAEVRKNIYFFGRRAANRTPIVGDTVPAKLLLVSDNSVLVEACGVQTRVPFPRLTGRKHLTSSNVLDYFPKDKAIPMVIEEINVDKENRTVEWRLSHRAAEDQIQKTILDESYIGRRFLGEVISVTEDYYISYCESENVTCSTPIDRCMTEQRLRHGDQVALQVYGIGKNFLKCNCRKI